VIYEGAATTQNNSSAILIARIVRTQAERRKLLLEGKRLHGGSRSQTAASPGAGWEQKPWLIITDIMMPEMDGYTLCRGIKSNADLKDTPVVLLTSLAEPEEVLKALSAERITSCASRMRQTAAVLGEYISANRESAIPRR